MDKHGKLIFDENRLADSELGDPEPEVEVKEKKHQKEFNAEKTIDVNSSNEDGLKSPPGLK